MLSQLIARAGKLTTPSSRRTEVGVDHEMAMPVPATVVIVDASLAIMNVAEGEDRIVTTAATLIGIAGKDAAVNERLSVVVAKVVVAVIGAHE